MHQLARNQVGTIVQDHVDLAPSYLSWEAHCAAGMTAWV